MAGRITLISVQKRNQNRLNVEINGNFALGLDRMIAAWLRTGQYLSDEEIASLKKRDSDEVLYQSAVHLISYKSRTKTELMERLIEKGYSQDQVQIVLDRLEESHLIDDRGYAERWVEDRSVLHPRSHRLMATEMRRKGIASEIALEALEGIKEDSALALEAGRKSLRRWQGLNEQDFKKKCADFLARRGFNYSVIRSILPDLWASLKDLQK
jgi:regulatory protein